MRLTTRAAFLSSSCCLSRINPAFFAGSSLRVFNDLQEKFFQAALISLYYNFGLPSKDTKFNSFK